MSDFWLGALVALTCWHVLGTMFGLALINRDDVEPSQVVFQAILALLFGFGAWYLVVLA